MVFERGAGITQEKTTDVVNSHMLIREVYENKTRLIQDFNL